MANMQFSWSDSLHAAVSSCLPCFKHPSSDSDSEDAQSRPPRNPAFAHAIPPPRARPDELEGLLADASDDADALSLHTNPGERRTRKKQSKNQNQRRRKGLQGPKHIRVFGFDLFGRPPAAIQLPESDDEDPRSGSGGLRPDREERERERARKISTSTLDSDAAPLDVSTIEALSAARHAEALAREEEERREKEERRRKRRERRELKRAAMAHALELQANGEDQFEGFQGSGPAYGAGMPFSPSVGSGTGTLSDSLTTSSQQEFGPFAHGQPVEPFDPDAAEAAREAAEAEADGADFGGESYTSRPRKSKSKKNRSAHGAGTMSTSDTRSSISSSRGTGSQGGTGTGPAPYNHQFLASLQAPTHVPGVPRSPLSPFEDSAPASPVSPNVTERKKRRKSAKSSSKSHAASLSVSTSSQSATASASATASSLASPPPSATAHPSAPRIASHDDGDDDGFEGFPGDFSNGDIPAAGSGGAMVDIHAGGEHGEEQEGREAEAEAEAKRDAYVPVARFPSAGFSRTSSSSRTSDAGVFLARRGDE
ncbi:hypothetical protein GSI_11037 [Ganoderma sinense ZZ0214-1]|uniref:Uncharacterized protein n=1 Tax=Ganoderma sinense ZZ0214-1 TaxID=1077348 RepID=A0A2G8RZE1_9APHY|nr:hypothetical protein GSI_11037 [Ganoderma sinense ZZ0214-1]